MEELKYHFTELLLDIANTDADFALYMLLVIAAVIVFDAISIFNRKNIAKSGLSSDPSDEDFTNVKALPARKYVSEMQGLAGTPDALIIENGYIIPVERKPMAKKLRDRYVAQLLVYMRLVEEFEGKKPPYGYLVLGRKCRRVKVMNSSKRQKWLQKTLDEMQAILHERAEAKPAPLAVKCRRCSVRNHCQHFEPMSSNHPEIVNGNTNAALKIIHNS